MYLLTQQKSYSTQVTMPITDNCSRAACIIITYHWADQDVNLVLINSQLYSFNMESDDDNDANISTHQLRTTVELFNIIVRCLELVRSARLNTSIREKDKVKAAILNLYAKGAFLVLVWIKINIVCLLNQGVASIPGRVFAFITVRRTS